MGILFLRLLVLNKGDRDIPIGKFLTGYGQAMTDFGCRFYAVFLHAF
jgi:hypothetical protein